MGYALLAVVATYLFIMHVQPYLELAFEYVKHDVSSILEWRQLELEQHKMEVMKKYPEMYKEVSDTVIHGFQCDNEEDIEVECQEDEEENEEIDKQ